MQKFELKTEIEIYNSVDELNASDALLDAKSN